MIISLLLQNKDILIINAKEAKRPTIDMHVAMHDIDVNDNILSITQSNFDRDPDRLEAKILQNNPNYKVNSQVTQQKLIDIIKPGYDIIEKQAAHIKYDLRRRHYLNSSTRSSFIASKESNEITQNSYASSFLSKIIADEPSEQGFQSDDDLNTDSLFNNVKDYPKYAKLFKFQGDTILNLCSYNSKIAKDNNLDDISFSWTSLAELYKEYTSGKQAKIDAEMQQIMNFSHQNRPVAK